MLSIDWAKIFSIGTLANEVEYSIAVYKDGGIVEKEKEILLAGVEFLNSVLEFEIERKKPNGQRIKGALPKLELLKASGSIVDAWIKSEIPFPKSDDEFEKELNTFIKALEDMALKKSVEAIGIEKINNVERLFSTLGEMALRKVHTSALYDRT